MSAIDGVSETFDPEAWDVVPGFEDLTDLTYHRAQAHGTVRIAFDRPDVLNAFRPHTVDELLGSSSTRAPAPTSAACCSPATARAPSTASGPSAPAATSGSAAAPATSTPTRRGDRGHRRQGQAGPAAHPGVPAADPVHAEGRHLRGQRLGGRRRPQPPRRLRPDPRQRRARAVQADRRRRRLLRRRVRVGVPRPAGGPEVRPRDLLPRRRVLRRGRAPDGHGQQGRAARRARGARRWSGAARSTARARPRSGC